MAKRKGWGNIRPKEPEIYDPLGLLDEDDSDSGISVYEAAEIWRDSGMDEDQMFGYSEEELRNALDS